MPYSNAYNRHIANEIQAINERFATQYAYSPVDGQGMSGGSNAGVLFQTASASKRDGEDNIYNDNYTGDMSLPSVYYYGNDSEGMKGGNGFAGGTYRDTGEETQLGMVGSGSAMGEFDKEHVWGGSNAVVGGDFWGTLGDIGSTALKFAPLLLALGKPMEGGKAPSGMEVGKAFSEVMKGNGMSGGDWWNDFIKGVGDVADVAGKVAPIAMKIFGGKRKKKGGDAAQAEIAPVGGAILGNPDPYPVQGNSVRLAGRGRKKKGGSNAVVGGDMNGKNGDLLAMPSPDLANGVPPKAQLRGSYGGSRSEVDNEIVADVKGMLGKKFLPGVTRKDPKVGDGRKARADIVKRIMKERGVKMIEASRIVKSEGLYKK